MTENTSETCEMCGGSEFDGVDGFCDSCGHPNDYYGCQCDACLNFEYEDEDEADEQ
jgi:hypothetical protein